ncbi:probable cytochrome P450 9f2 [Bradysia coprophila]|uniref:probable cytochrome P450 9f2 n=1 Tax=Bradysia coprophila TaxID=38358 RepID=UPI00187D85E9|nr:probable cytochrome P450 9f2 [Bradysia coprophila]
MLGAFIIIIAIFLFSLAFYKWATINNDYFEKRNMKFSKPTFLFGSMRDFFYSRGTLADFANKIYREFPNEAVNGLFGFRQPQFLLRDPDVIKQIAVKDFDHFEDRFKFIDPKLDKLWGNSLFLMESEKWRLMRATLSPAFTGSKMRQMFNLVVEVAESVMQHLLKKVENGEKVDVEMKDFFTRYTNDVIASCAFGLKVNSVAEPKNEFYLNGKELLNFFGLVNLIKSMIIMTTPSIARLLKLNLTGKVGESFSHIILDTMEERKTKSIFRPDMINIMMQVREGTLKQETEEKKKEVDGFSAVEESEIGKETVNRAWSDDELVAQCFIFFIAGFETSSAMLTFASYELAANPDIQQKLYEEIAAMNEQLNGKSIHYDALQKLKYLDQVFSETMRKWPPLFQIDRQCTKEYIFDNGSLKFKVEKGQTVLIPVYGIQHDAKHFPEPEKFDPDRFSDENKNSIHQGTYMPFGIGPRNCIGSRFALMELKAILYYVLLNFTIEPNEKSEIPLKPPKMTTAATMLPRTGVHFELKPRKK